MKQQLTDYINAAFAGIWIQTNEPDEAQKEITGLCTASKWTLTSWDCAAGFNGSGDGKGDPLAPLKPTASTANDSTHVVILHNYHRFLQSPVVMQALFNAILAGKSTRTFYVILAPVVQIPIECEKVFVVLEHELPTQDNLNIIAVDLLEGPDKALNGYHEGVKAATGLTRYEAEGAFALSIARSARIQAETVWELKTQMLKKSGLLTLHRGSESFTDLGGLHAIKNFCKKAILSNKGTTRPKGVLLLGVPGTGKSAFAKALGKEVGRPTLVLDIGSLMGSLVGETEQKVRLALKIADAMQPCVLFVDEIEKAFAGATSSHQGDGGVKAGMLGAFLTWMQDHETDVFVICTSNDISALPPEFTRAERFDAVFFIDMPDRAQREDIWLQYIETFGITKKGIINDDNWTGAEIRSCCRLASLLDCSLHEAATYIVPIAQTAGSKVSALREWAAGKCLDANAGGIYQNVTKQPAQKRRSITSV